MSKCKICHILCKIEGEIKYICVFIIVFIYSYVYTNLCMLLQNKHEEEKAETNEIICVDCVC